MEKEIGEFGIDEFIYSEEETKKIDKVFNNALTLITGLSLLEKDEIVDLNLLEDEEILLIAKTKLLEIFLQKDHCLHSFAIILYDQLSKSINTVNSTYIISIQPYVESIILSWLESEITLKKVGLNPFKRFDVIEESLDKDFSKMFGPNFVLENYNALNNRFFKEPINILTLTKKSW